MTKEEFKRHTAEPTDRMSSPAQALWYDHAGDWDRAHEVAQSIHTRMGSRIHAYLHRKEGDLSNAGYWYSRAGIQPFTGTLDAEWELLVADCFDDRAGNE